MAPGLGVDGAQPVTRTAAVSTATRYSSPGLFIRASRGDVGFASLQAPGAPDVYGAADQDEVERRLRRTEHVSSTGVRVSRPFARAHVYVPIEVQKSL